MATGYFFHAACLGHDMGRGHPECPARLQAIEEHLRSSGVAALLVRQEAPEVGLDALVLAHERGHVLRVLEAMNQASLQGRAVVLEADTWACAQTQQAALRAAGAAVAATDAVIEGQLRNAFCAVRPPGHHATRAQVMGFCFFNNVAVAMRHALDVKGLRRVAVVDFDVHHGNGTEDILINDDRILMVSFFQHPFYPHCGTPTPGPHFINVPVPAHTGGDQVRALIREQWLPALERFKPEMIFISAGFDAHREDPLGQMNLIEEDYTWITQRLVQVADRHAQGRIVSVLEGGYSLSALARSVTAHLRVLTSA